MRNKVWMTGLVSVVALPAVAAAHNVGHIFRSDGTCLEVGSVKEAPLVGQDRTQLDLVPGTANPPRDEYGTSFVGYWGNTPILPGRCPVATGTASSVSVAGASARSSSASATAKPSTSPGSRAGSVGPWMSLSFRRDR